MPGFAVRAGGAIFSQTEVLAEVIVFLLSTSCSQLEGTRGHQIFVNQANTICFTPVILQHLVHPTCGLIQATSSSFSIQTSCLCLCRDFPKISQRSTNPNKKHPGSACPLPLFKQPPPGTSGGQPQFTAQPLTGTSKPNTIYGNHMQITV